MPQSDKPDRRASASRRFLKCLRVNMYAGHDLELQDAHYAPRTGPALIMTDHASILDTPVLMAVDPYPNTAMVAKASIFRVPIVRRLLAAWSAIPVQRTGEDFGSVRTLGALRAGEIVGIVGAEGRRSRTGRLGDINPVLARHAARAAVPVAPVLPVGIAGSHRALPPGARMPRRCKIVVRVGAPFRLERDLPPPEAERRIREAIAALQPPDQQPDGWTPRP